LSRVGVGGVYWVLICHTNCLLSCK